MLKEVILESLECVVEKVGDPVEPVYARLFEKYPDMQDLFILDKTGGARGHMLSEVLDCVIDFCDGDNYATNFVASERMNHEGIGVPADVFSTFLDIVVEVFKEISGDRWSSEIDAAWSRVVTALKPLPQAG